MANKKSKGNSPTKIKPNTLDPTFLTVGIGASAGGLEAFKEFFEAMPEEPGMGFVIVQHLDPTHKSLMVSLLKNHTKMKVMEVTDRTPIAPNVIFVIPPNKDMAIFNGVLHLMEPTVARGFRRPIDYFLRSLAEDQKENAVGIILSGTGTEGTLSLKDIKGQGGLTIVQEPETAKYDGMPRSAINAGVEDFVLPVAKMPEFLLKYAKKRVLKPIEKSHRKGTDKELMEKIFILLRQETGCNFSDYKTNTITRRFEKRMALNQIDTMERYLRYLQKNKEEVQKLFNELLIGVTGFFRDPEAFEGLSKIVVNKILDKKKEGETLRVWVSGCSTGEEAYSLLMLLDEAITSLNKNLTVQIFATDLDKKAIDFARIGIYPDTIATEVSISRLKNYFIPGPHSYTIKKEVRDRVIFSVHNLIKDPPFSKLDLISCRNLLIYLNVEAQKKVFSIFHYALLPEGILFLGNSESLGEFSTVFSTLDRKNKIYVHKNIGTTKTSNIDYLFQEPAFLKNNLVQMPKKVNINNLEHITEHLLLDNYAPACVVVNSKGDAVYFRGDTGKYLQPSPGEARLQIIDMAREGLKTELPNLILKTQKSKKKEIKKGIPIKNNGKLQLVDLALYPFRNFGSEEDLLLLTFIDRSDTPKVTSSKPKPKTAKEISEVNALEQELAATKEYLRTTIEQLEISNEELKSSNEELQSSNEELQSTNEEMETSKEEMQSVNEEIITVNSELQDKIDELAQAYDDMNNLLSSTEIGTLFLDSNFKIRRFTPIMNKIINIIETDVGRSVTDLYFNLDYEELFKDIKSVLDTLNPVKKNIKSKDGLWYYMQVMPYRTSENVIEGTVITFVNVTQEVTLAEELKKYKENYEHLLKITKTVVCTQNMELKYTSIVNAWPNFDRNNIIGKTDKELFGKVKTKRLEKIKEKVLKTESPIRETIPLYFEGKLFYYDFTVRPLYENYILIGIAITATDITDLTKVESTKSVKNGTG